MAGGRNKWQLVTADWTGGTVMDWDKLLQEMEYVPRRNYSTAPKLSQKDVNTIREVYSTDLVSMRQLGKMFEVNASTILRIVRHEIW